MTGCFYLAFSCILDPKLAICWRPSVDGAVWACVYAKSTVLENQNQIYNICDLKTTELHALREIHIFIHSLGHENFTFELFCCVRWHFCAAHFIPCMKKLKLTKKLSTGHERYKLWYAALELLSSVVVNTHENLLKLLSVPVTLTHLALCMSESGVTWVTAAWRSIKWCSHAFVGFCLLRHPEEVSFIWCRTSFCSLSLHSHCRHKEVWALHNLMSNWESESMVIWVAMVS